MPQKKPTKKQTILLNFIADFTEKNQYPPSYREIQVALGLRSVSAVAEHIDNCVAAGFLRKTSHSARSLEIIPLTNYQEVSKAFNEKIAELAEKPSKKDDLQVLLRAAEILGVDLKK